MGAALRLLQKSTIHNRHSSINACSAAGRINCVAVQRAKIRHERQGCRTKKLVVGCVVALRDSERWLASGRDRSPNGPVGSVAPPGTHRASKNHRPAIRRTFRRKVPALASRLNMDFNFFVRHPSGRTKHGQARPIALAPTANFFMVGLRGSWIVTYWWLCPS
jgi:hypothetical protein